MPQDKILLACVCSSLIFLKKPCPCWVRIHLFILSDHKSSLLTPGSKKKCKSGHGRKNNTKRDIHLALPNHHIVVCD